MQTSELHDIATTLRAARANAEPVAAPTRTWPGLDVDSAFAVQRITTEEAVADGDRLVGYKLGNIAKVMQDAFGLDQPDYGYLLGSTFAYEGVPQERQRYIEPFVELEPAFLLKHALRGPHVTTADVINAVEYAVPAIEIIDSRVENWAIGLPDTLADNGSTGAVILGGTPRRIADLSLNDTRGTLHFNGRHVVEGNTRNILGNPFAATAWLCNRLAAYDIAFEPGQVILPGSCLRAVPMNEPGRWTGTFEGWGTVEFDVTTA
ncbi:2-keto-4-pentenoate hydratase [Streptomyces sp. NPDC005962]|uniref:2-keto-4-pentenoate hydratase n=1 Tax=Streptomyces sp. NPDC005962 TaxID=3154466 RepID=UPI0034040C17